MPCSPVDKGVSSATRKQFGSEDLAQGKCGWCSGATVALNTSLCCGVGPIPGGQRLYGLDEVREFNVGHVRGGGILTREGAVGVQGWAGGSLKREVIGEIGGFDVSVSVSRGEPVRSCDL